MKQTFLGILGKNGPYIVVFLSLTSAIFFLIADFYGEQGRRIQILKDGVGTCFFRLGQSYEARILGNTASSSLKEPFVANTEECFAEAISYADSLFFSMDQNIARILHFISSEAYWLNQKILGHSENVFSHSQDNNSHEKTTSRFNILKTETNQLQSILESHYSSSHWISSLCSYITYSLLFLLICKALFEFYLLKFSHKKEIIPHQKNRGHLLTNEPITNGLKLCLDKIAIKAFKTRTKIRVKVNKKCKIPLDKDRLNDFLFYSTKSAMDLGSKSLTIETKRCGTNDVINIVGHGVSPSDDINSECSEFKKLRKIIGPYGDLSFTNKIRPKSFIIGLSANKKTSSQSSI